MLGAQACCSTAGRQLAGCPLAVHNHPIAADTQAPALYERAAQRTGAGRLGPRGREKQRQKSHVQHTRTCALAPPNASPPTRRPLVSAAVQEGCRLLQASATSAAGASAEGKAGGWVQTVAGTSLLDASHSCIPQLKAPAPR